MPKRFIGVLVCAAWFFSIILFTRCTGRDQSELPEVLMDYLTSVDYGTIGGKPPEVSYQVFTDSLVKISLTWDLQDTVRQDDWQVVVSPAFKPDFHWAPHLTPTNDHIIAQHLFRSPALIVSSAEKQLTIVPDLDLLLKKTTPVDWYMDMNAPGNQLVLGMSRSKVKEHVLFTREAGAVYPPGKVTFGFYIMISDNEGAIFNPFRKVLSFFWTNWGDRLYENGEPLGRWDLDPYVKHTYSWAFDSWRESVWQEFNLNGKKVGAPVFIVNVTRSPNFNGEPKNREFASIWNQAWFNSLRSASGLYRYAKRTDNNRLLEYALMTKELALSFPQKSGFFPAVIAPKSEASRVASWKNFYFGNSNRNPYTWDASQSPYHILDMSFTSLQMLHWYDELEQDERLLKYATVYADALMRIQDEKGFFPGWVHTETLEPLQHLNESPETSMSVTFLLKLYELTKDEKYRTVALKAMQAVMKDIVPAGRWEDFETYWSCNPYGADTLIGQKVTRNNMYKQNNFSMYWTAEALLESYKTTGDRRFLKYGQRTLDELLMTQASWQPPYMYVRTLGGFGVMNADGEWNDSRQSLFSELIVRYGKVQDKKEYIRRGLAALRASFVMMYCPENPETKEQWERRWPFFGEEDYGFMMENYGHGGTTSPEGEGMGEFTIYDWGNGAASEAWNRMLDRYGKEFLMEN